jgi:hypothetical protein
LPSSIEQVYFASDCNQLLTTHRQQNLKPKPLSRLPKLNCIAGSARAVNVKADKKISGPFKHGGAMTHISKVGSLKGMRAASERSLFKQALSFPACQRFAIKGNQLATISFLSALTFLTLPTERCFALGDSLSALKPFFRDLFVTNWFSAKRIEDFRSQGNRDFPPQLADGEIKAIGLRISRSEDGIRNLGRLACTDLQVVAVQDYLAVGGSIKTGESFRRWAEKAVVSAHVERTVFLNLSSARVAVAALLPRDHSPVFNRDTGMINQGAIDRVMRVHLYGYDGFYSNQLKSKSIRLISSEDCSGGFTIMHIEVK